METMKSLCVIILLLGFVTTNAKFIDFEYELSKQDPTFYKEIDWSNRILEHEDVKERWTREATIMSGFGRLEYEHNNFASKVYGGCNTKKQIKFVPKKVKDFQKLSFHHDGLRAFDEVFTFNGNAKQLKKNGTLPQTQEKLWKQIKTSLEKKMPKCLPRPGYCGKCEDHQTKNECEAKVDSTTNEKQGCSWHENLHIHKISEVYPAREHLCTFSSLM